MVYLDLKRPITGEIFKTSTWTMRNLVVYSLPALHEPYMIRQQEHTQITYPLDLSMYAL
jgi:hypothetical protein